MTKLSTGFVIVALAVVVAMSFTTLAAAQRVSGEERDAIFASAQKVATGVPGVMAFAAPPKGFNPLTATNRELLSYGLPQRPDKEADAMGYQQWEGAMLALKTHATGLTAKPYSSTSMKSVGSAKPDASGVTLHNSYNWSGIANTNKNTTWKKTSFDEVASAWNVPVSNPPWDAPCSWAPWVEVTWNGIDGFSNGDVVQGGSASIWDACGGPVGYFGWVEWAPSYPILEINAPVGPGDDFYVITYGAPGTSTQNVFVEDYTQEWAGTFSMAYVTGPGLVGSSAEYIVERPCCVGQNYYALNNYIFEFMGYNLAYDVAGTQFYPGSAAASTAVITMVADDGSTVISYPYFYGTAGNAGKYSIFIKDANCAFLYGCAP